MFINFCNLDYISFFSILFIRNVVRLKHENSFIFKILLNFKNLGGGMEGVNLFTSIYGNYNIVNKMIKKLCNNYLCFRTNCYFEFRNINNTQFN